MNYQNLCFAVIEIAKKAALFIENEKGRINQHEIEIKGKNDFVTRVDKSAEQLIVSGLEPLIDGAGFITEENTNTKQGETYQWIVDPLDGTTNFIHGLPCFCVSIGLLHQQEIVVGVIYEVNQQECFYAWQGGGAYLNGNRIEVSKANSLKDSLLATGFPYYNYSKLTNYLELFRYFMQHSHGLRRLGSAAADMAYVAAGRMEGFYEYALKPWDVAAGVILIKEAGGMVGDFKGGNNYLFGQEIVCAASGVYTEMLQVVGEYMNAK